MPKIKIFKHRAWHKDLQTYVFWDHTAPDEKGEHAPHNPSDLHDVVVIKVFEEMR